MRPERTLDGDVVRRNVAAFRALGAPVAAVVKHDGYGWGAGRLARELDDAVESYIVSDEDELAALRPFTARPIRLLAEARPGRCRDVLELGGIPAVAGREALEEAGAEADRRDGVAVRIGILDAAGWTAIRPADAEAFAAAVGRTRLAVELWTHVTSTARSAAIVDGLRAAKRSFEEAGVRVVSVDASGTGAARRDLAFDRLRVGAGLFGARLGSTTDLRCAIGLRAPIVRRFAPGEIAWAGYGEVRVPPNRSAVVLRCGYGDGFPEALRNDADILSVGMQYTTRLVSHDVDPTELIGPGDDLDQLAARAAISAHALVVGLAPR